MARRTGEDSQHHREAGERVVRRAGLPDRDRVFRQPDGCADAPRLPVTAEAQCHLLELRLSNEGTAPVTGPRLYSPASPTADELAPVAPGEVTLVRRLADGDSYALVGGAPGPEQVTWMAGTYREPAGCGPEAIAVEFTNDCAGVRVTLTSRADGASRVTVLVDGVAAVHRVVAARARDTFTVPARPGAVVLARHAELALDLATHTVGAAACGSSPPDPFHRWKLSAGGPGDSGVRGGREPPVV